MRSPGRLAIGLTAALSLPFATVAEACIPEGRSVLLMLDASYSMLRAVTRTGPTRFVVAREALYSVVDRYPRDGYLALRLYGSQSHSFKENCSDTVLAVPFAQASANAAIIKLTLAQSHARGLTPISLALEQAVADFGDAYPDKRIVIVTDGGESCGGNPCATALKMAEQGFVIDTVGFLLNDAIARQQLECIAKVTKGTYVDVRAHLELVDRLTNLLAECAIVEAPAARDWDGILALTAAMS
jgi:Ca-activated chloride channel family protein